MNKISPVKALLLTSSLLAWAGCSAPGDIRVRETIADPTVTTAEFHGERRLFSRVGLSALDEEKKRLVAELYRPDGTIDSAKVDRLQPEVRATPWADGVRLDFPSNPYADVVLKPGYFISLDPKFDPLVRGTAQIANRHRTAPIVPLTIPK